MPAARNSIINRGLQLRTRMRRPVDWMKSTGVVEGNQATREILQVITHRLQVTGVKGWKGLVEGKRQIDSGQAASGAYS